MPQPLPVGSYLDRWQRELKRGQRTTSTYDLLWQAACWEIAALAHAPDSKLYRDNAMRAQLVMAGVPSKDLTRAVKDALRRLADEQRPRESFPP